MTLVRTLRLIRATLVLLKMMIQVAPAVQEMLPIMDLLRRDFNWIRRTKWLLETVAYGFSRQLLETSRPNSTVFLTLVATYPFCWSLLGVFKNRPIQSIRFNPNRSVLKPNRSVVLIG